MKTSPFVALAVALVAPALGAAPRQTRLSQTAPARGATTATPAARSRPAPAAPAPAAPTPAPPAAGSALSADQVVTQLQAFYDRTTDFEADFVQVSRNRLSGTDQRRNGHVRFMRPGKMRWDYRSPAGDLIVSDGTTLWAYEAAARQAVQSNMAQSALPSALSFLTGTGRLSNDFTFRLLDARRLGYPTGHVLEARPKTPNPSFERIVFYVEPAHFQVARTAVYDAQGNLNRFDFANPRVNMNPAPAVFQWSPPPGTQIVRP